MYIIGLKMHLFNAKVSHDIKKPRSHDLVVARSPLECQKLRAETLAMRGVSSLKTLSYPALC